jgi:hypothetical protein
MNDNIPTKVTPWADIGKVFSTYDRKQFQVALLTIVLSFASLFAAAAVYETDIAFYALVGLSAFITLTGNVFTAINDKGRRSAMRALLGNGRWVLPDGAVGSFNDSSGRDVEFKLVAGRAVFSEREIWTLAQY